MSTKASTSTEQPNVRFISGMVFLLLLLAGIVYGAWAIKQWAEDEQKSPVRDIALSGDLRFVDQKQIESLIRRTQPGSFFELDVEQAHQDIERLPWVYRASIRKRWPNSLKIYVLEQTPAARWNDDLILNQYGDAFEGAVGKGKAAPDLPDLFGPGGSEHTALDGYNTMQSLLASAGMGIDELFLSERFAWHVKLLNGISLNLGRTEYIDRLQRFIDLYPLLKKNDKAVDYVDLRYDTGLAVGWKSPEQPSQES
ncbi:cell division protein FtsQ/DivIB [Paraglaciecola polaris]|uniref:Cell division protein FtsQ n=1 Tax=Paraglaciecola polaris LMG 21857 TaxID=1129793 RepID=K6ZPL0_9ALTE|nr:cell division protein FtsQ/DivIB [Paraglaciecola polaris]GAC32232.1 cell division protein FtsQ [Paraglaciecola polaris LMG 21857]